MLIYTEQDLKRYMALNRQAKMPAVMRIEFPNRNLEVDMKTAYMKDEEMFAI